MYAYKYGFVHENAPIARGSTTIGRAYWPKLHGCAIIRGEGAPLKACVSACEGPRGGTGVPPVTGMARMAMPQGSARADVAPTLRSAFSVSARRADLKVGATKHRGFPLCNRNKRELAMISENLEKIYIIETKIVSSFLVAG